MSRQACRRPSATLTTRPAPRRGHLASRRSLARFAAIPALLLFIAAPQRSPAASPEGARIEGRILREDGKSAAQGSIVKAVHLETGAHYAAEPAGRDGRYRIGGLPFGYFQIVIEAGAVLHAVQGPVGLEPGRTRKADIVLLPPQEAPTGAEGVETGVAVAGFPSRAQALAVIPDEGKKSFLRNPAGLGAAAGAVLLLLLVG